MQNITSSAELKNAIRILEIEQTVNGQLLKDQLYLTCESLKPANILKNTLKDITSSPNLIDNILGTAMGLITGYFSRKIVIGTSGNIFRKLFGSIVQIGVTDVVSQHPDAIKSFAQFIFQRIFRKKEINTKKL